MNHSQKSRPNPIRSTGKLLLTSVFSLIVVIGLVYIAAKSSKSVIKTDNSELAVATRIQRVGSIELKAGERKLRNGAESYAAQCAACHATGMVGSPKFGDSNAWGPRIGKGFDALLNSAMKGKGAMGPQSGGNLNDLEIARALVHMANAGGAKFTEPTAPTGTK